MVALIVGMSIMAVLMTAVMPAWKQAAQREREAELIFRGQQYARAIGLFQRRAGPGVLPPNIDVLVDGHYLRKKYKDPITGEDFDLLTATQATTPGGTPPPAGRQGAGQTGSVARVATAPGAVTGGAPAPTGRGGIVGVASKSKAQSIRIYNGRTHYNEWQFVYVAQTQAPGQGGGRGQPQRAGPGQNGTAFPGGIGGGRNGGRGRGDQTPPPFGRGDGQQPPAGRGGSTGFPPPNGRLPPRP